MKAPLLNISGMIEPPLVELYESVAMCAENLKIPYLVVGASARDMILHYGHGMPIQRATKDIDFALQVPAWSAFEALKVALIEKGFIRTSNEHTLIAPSKLPIDIVPFGGLADENANIQWPSSGDFVMNVLGFQEAINNAQLVRLKENPALDIPVASIEGLTILKLVAWMDRTADIRGKDAKDLVYLLESYEKIPTISKQLYEDGTVMDQYGWDSGLAASHLLGVNARTIALPQTVILISNLLSNQDPKLSIERLINEMGGRSDNQYAKNAALINSFTNGFLSV